MRTRQKPTPGISSELNLFAGALNLHNAEQDKRGWSGEANGRYNQKSGRWFVHEVTGKINANLSRIRSLASGTRDDSRDVVGNLNGNLSLFNQSRVGLKTTYNLQTSDVGQPGTLGDITRVKSSRAGADAALRTRLGADGYVSLTQQFAHNDQVTALNGPSSRNTNGLLLDARTT